MKSNTKLAISVAAHKDWRQILHYTRRIWGEDQVEVYDEVLWNAFQRIKSFPEIGRPSSHCW